MRDPVRNYVKEMISKYKFKEPILDCGAGWEPNFYQPLFPNMKYIKQDAQDYDPLSGRTMMLTGWPIRRSVICSESRGCDSSESPLEVRTHTGGP